MCQFDILCYLFRYRRNLSVRVRFHMISAKLIRQEVFADVLVMCDGVEVTSFVDVRLSIVCLQMQSVTEHRPQKRRTVNENILVQLVYQSDVSSSCGVCPARSLSTWNLLFLLFVGLLLCTSLSSQPVFFLSILLLLRLDCRS